MTSGRASASTQSWQVLLQKEVSTEECLEFLQRLATEEKQLTEGNKIGGPARDLLPETGQQRITRLRLQHPTAGRNGNCQRSITKLSFFCYLDPEEILLTLSVVHSLDYPEGPADSHARTCLCVPVAGWWREDAWLPNSKHPGKW